MKRALVLAALSTMALSIVPEVAAAPSRLAFGYDGDRGAGVYVIDIDGTGLRRISGGTKMGLLNPSFESDWSPDGDEIAFVARRNDADGTFTVNTDGTDLTRVSKAPCYSEYSPSWSPDASQIALRHDTCERMHVWVVGSDGRGKPDRNISSGLGYLPEWRPNGGWITYTKRRQTTEGWRDDIYVVRPDGSRDRRVTLARGHRDTKRGSLGNDSAKWSPNGRWLAFVGGDEATDSSSRGVCIVRFEGIGERCLTNGSRDESYPDWSPTGRRIVYESVKDGNSDIYTIRRNGKRERRLTHSDRDDMQPVWSPDGRWIAFLSKRDGNTELYVMHPDGSHKRRLTRSPGAETAPDWEPR